MVLYGFIRFLTVSHGFLRFLTFVISIRAAQEFLEIGIQWLSRSLITILLSNFQNYTTAKSSREAQILLKIRVQRFSRSLIRIFLLDFRNSKWRIQYGNVRSDISLNCVQNRCTEVFEVTDHDLDIRLLTFKEANAIRHLKILNSSSFPRNWSTVIFGTAYHDLDISLSKFIMAVKSLGEAQIQVKIRIQGFSRSLIKILLLDLGNSKWGNQYGF